MTRRAAGPRHDPKTGTWWFVVDIGVGPDGHRRQAKRRGFATKNEAQKAFDKLRVRAREGAYVAPSRQTVGEFLTDEWLPAVRVTLEASTWESYERNLRVHVIPAIGQVYLQALDGARLNRLYASLLLDGRKRGKGSGLSARTVRYIHTILHAALDDAVRWERAATNAASKSDPPSARAAKAPEMKTWTAEELAHFLELTAKDRYNTSWLFLATTGTRRGETLGLRWSDIDLETGYAVIRQTITAVGDKVRIAPRTKSDRPRRIELDSRTVMAMRVWRARQAQEKLLLGTAYQDAGLVFCHPDGRPFHPKRFSREFDRRLTRFGLRRIRLHDLRHTWATLALQAGIDVKVVAERLGHSSPTITWAIYQHVTPAMQSGAAEKVAGLIFGLPS
jgi:integrase